MFKKLLLRSVATSAAVGSVFAASLVATPAVVATAPEIRTVACDYPATAATETVLDLSREGGHYGAINWATATVSATDGGNAVPTGAVRFAVRDQTRGVVTDAATVGLDGNGQAELRLNRYLRANRTYMVTATYIPDDTCEFQVSEARTASFYFVFKRNTSTAVDAPSVRRFTRPAVTVSVGNRYFEERLWGKVRVVITKKGSNKALRATTTRLTDRAATVSFKRLNPGLYTAKVRYLGNVNYAASSGADGFRVRR